ncbi:hypothetical protein CBS101457_002416 [Exobasidium rhododendri]|nr:hypothetical protein CBS101457_002416 [Exobasidium rhododendri]
MTEQNTSKSGQGVGDVIKGIFSAGHGAGETIRGTINNTLDSFGDGIASDGKTTGTDTKRAQNLENSGHAPQNHANTVETGKQELNNGINSISHAGK